MFVVLINGAGLVLNDHLLERNIKSAIQYAVQSTLNIGFLSYCAKHIDKGFCTYNRTSGAQEKKKQRAQWFEQRYTERREANDNGHRLSFDTHCEAKLKREEKNAWGLWNNGTTLRAYMMNASYRANTCCISLMMNATTPNELEKSARG